jgi:WTAP/Mum2p family
MTGTGYYNSISPKASFDSINSSLHSLGANSMSSNTAVTPWMSTSSFSAIGSNTQQSDISSRHSSVLLGDNYLDSFPGRHHDQGDFLNEFSQEGNKTSLREQDLIFRPSTSNSSRHNSVPGFSTTTPPTQIDPSVEIAFRNMAKNLQDKDKALADLKLQIEALVTALAIEGTGRNDKAVQKFLETNKMDVDEIAHRIVVRLKVLTEENETLGIMLSQSRAAQKEVELGILRRENSMLKGRLDGMCTSEGKGPTIC